MEQSRRTRLRDRAADQVLEMVISGGLEPGERLPPVRDTLSLLLRVQPKTLWELLEIRKILEVEVAGLAAELAGPDDVTAMRLQLARMRVSIEAPEGYVD